MFKDISSNKFLIHIIRGRHYMKHEIFDTKINVSDSEITFEKIYEKDYIPQEYIDDIKNANFLLIPNNSYYEEGCLLFPETTRDFFDFVREQKDERIIADIAISDEDFQCIELHSAIIEVAKVIVQWGVLPIVTSMIASFLYELVKKYHRNPEETSAKVQIITEETKTKKSKQITYEGPVSGIKDALDQATKELF